MKYTLADCLLALLRYEIAGEEIPDGMREAFDGQMLEELYKCAKMQELSHLVGDALIKNGFLKPEDRLFPKFERRQLAAVFYVEKLCYEQSRIEKALENAGVPFIPMKGSVLRGYYPEAWMRNSSDLDILVHKGDLQKAADAIVSECGYSRTGKSRHDWQLMLDDTAHVELHFDLVEKGCAVRANEVLNEIWSYAEPVAPGRMKCVLKDEMFYFYHIAHMAKHIESSGCGIRFFVDLWVYEHAVKGDEKKRAELLEKGGLLAFCRAAKELTDVWMNGKAHSESSRRFEKYIFNSGITGTMANRVVVQRQKQGGIVRFALTRLFPPSYDIRLRYPVTEKHKWLMPVMYVRRWGDAILEKKMERIMREAKYSKDVSPEQLKESVALFNDLGLISEKGEKKRKNEK